GLPLLSVAVVLVTPPCELMPVFIEMVTLMWLLSPLLTWLKLLMTFSHSRMAVSTTERAVPALDPKTAAKLSEACPRLVQLIVDGTRRSSSSSRHGCCLALRRGCCRLARLRDVIRRDRKLEMGRLIVNPFRVTGTVGPR